jgi:hypothetical protein
MKIRRIQEIIQEIVAVLREVSKTIKNFLGLVFIITSTVDYKTIILFPIAEYMRLL